MTTADVFNIGRALKRIQFENIKKILNIHKLCGVFFVFSGKRLNGFVQSCSFWKLNKPELSRKRFKIRRTWNFPQRFVNAAVNYVEWKVETWKFKQPRLSRQQQRHEARISLIKRGKMFVLHVRHAFPCISLLHITWEFYSIKLICTNLFALFLHVKKDFTANQNGVQIIHVWKYNQSTIA